MAHIIYTYKNRVINLSALAERLAAEGVKGASLSNLSRVFAGRHRPRLDLAIAIARVGGIPLEEINEMLAHCARQREDWKDVPVFGHVRPPAPRQPKVVSNKSRKRGGG